MTSDREQFAPDELAVALSHYDLGVIESAILDHLDFY